jgi:type I restriction enzyme S subunit
MKEIKLIDLIEEISMGPFGSNIKVDNFKATGIPVLNGSNLISHKLVEDSFNYISKEKADSLGKANAKRGDIVITHRGTLGQVSVITEDSRFDRYVISQSQFRVRFNQEINPTYFSYLMKSKYGQGKLLSFKNHVGVPALAQATTNFKNLEMLIHNISDQQKIAAVLSALDDKIEFNNRINAELEQMAKTLYDYWFVQFDFPDENGKPYKSTGGKMVFNEVLKREVPERWEVKVFNDWIAKTKAGDWGKEEEEGNYTERVYCVRGADINGLNGKGEIKAPERFILKKNLAKALKPNDFIIEISGGSPTQSTARIALMTEKTFERFDANIICSNFCKAVTIKDEKYIFNFQQEWQSLYDAGVFFGYEGKTSGIKNFLFDSFMNSYQVVLPKKEIVDKYYEYAKSLEEKKQSNLQQNQELSSLRDWLLPMLMNGQVRVDALSDQVSENDNRKEDDLSMAAEPQSGYGKAAPLNIPENRKGFAKQVLAGKIVSQFKDDPAFTNIKFQKIQFLAEHIIEANLNLNYYYQAAGPYDNKFMHTIHNDFRKQKWFDCRNMQFNPLEKQEKIEGYYQGYFGAVQKKLDQLFELLYQKSEAEAEIIATLYAVWNNRIIEGSTVADKELIEDFYKWSDRKQQYMEEQILNALQWLRTHQMEPKGFGKLIKKAKGKK